MMKAPILAHEDSQRYGIVLDATTAVIFLGTFHRGASGGPDIKNVLGEIISACLYVTQGSGITGKVRTDLLKAVLSDLETLKDIATSFRTSVRDLDIATFYEAETIPLLGYLVIISSLSRCLRHAKPMIICIVDKLSAFMDIPKKEVIPLCSNHTVICRFPGMEKNTERSSWQYIV
jgi:mannose/fructose/N-acetylgalactosamine-specific phosphotransferase system component IIC